MASVASTLVPARLNQTTTYTPASIKTKRPTNGRFGAISHQNLGSISTNRKVWSTFRKHT